MPNDNREKDKNTKTPSVKIHIDDAYKEVVEKLKKENFERLVEKELKKISRKKVD